MEANASSTGDDTISHFMQKLDRASHPRALSDGSVKLFGVRLSATYHNSSMMMMRKTVSMGNLSAYNHTNPPPLRILHPSASDHSESGEALGGPTDPHGYVSDGLVQNSGSLRERKKGVPWTEEEHRMFLAGLQKLGKGDWRGIARTFVPSRTPTQVASHAQKYFLRQSNMGKRKRRSSLFDMMSSPVSPLVTKAAVPGESIGMELNLVSSTRVSAELHLGLPHEAHREQPSPLQRWSHQFSANMLGSQMPLVPPRTGPLPLTLSFPSPTSLTDRTVAQSEAATGPFSSSSVLSSSSSSSSLSSLGRIDESPEHLPGLTLSIGPPLLIEPSAELTLKLGQPSATRHSAMEGSANGSSRITNAIQVV